jgi:RimJ/RimL family protein N-acetyltransferase
VTGEGGSDPRLETDRLLLRPPRAGDVPGVHEAIGDLEVMRYIGRGETGTAADAVAQIERIQQQWVEDRFGRFMVVRKTDGALLGRVGLLAWDPRSWESGLRTEIGERAEIELGWTLVRRAWGFGYATEAAAAVRDWALREVRARRLISLIHPENERSLRVAAKLGERYERTVTTHRGMPAQLWTFPAGEA